MLIEYEVMAAFESDYDQTPVDDLVRVFGSKWDGFWKWLDRIGDNARRAPSHPSRQAVREADRCLPEAMKTGALLYLICLCS